MNSHPIKVNPLPPQAYTKEILQKAYAWLLNQSSNIKEMATTQDMLISLYLKAQRSGEASLDTPSIQNFKQELKNLASMMGDLQTPGPVSVRPTLAPAPTPLQNNSSRVSELVSDFTQTIKEATNNAAAASSAANQNSGFTGGANHNLGQLDLQSLQILAEIKQSLNLSSELEALRALISLGYRQFKKIN